MEQFVEYFLKSAGVLSIFVLVYHFLLRRLTFFTANRWFLILGIVASIGFPLVEITQTVYVEQPATTIVYMPQKMATPMAAVLENPVAETSAPFDYWQLLAYLYIAVVLFFIGKMMVELTSLYRLIKSGTMVQEDEFVMVTLSRKLTPFSFFNYICYSASEKPSAALDVIINHEKVHAKQWHSIDVLLSHLYRAIFWINPLAWWLKKQIGENLEFIADAEAKTQTKTDVSYERTLLSSAAFHLQPSLANNFFTPFIKKRIMMLQKEASARWNAYKYALILPVIVLFLYSFNVVTEVEYIEKENPTDNIENTIMPVSVDESNDLINSDDVAKANSSVSREVSFSITNKTTAQSFKEIESQVNKVAKYKLKFKDEIRNSDNELETISIYTKFPGKAWYRNMTIEINNLEPYFFNATLDRLSLIDEESEHYITENGVQLNDDLLDKEDIEDSNASIVFKTFSITSTMTKSQVQALIDKINKASNAAIKIKTIRYNDGKLTKLKLTVTNPDGKSDYAFQRNDGIKPVCLKVTDNEITSVDCENNVTYALGDVMYFDTDDMEFPEINSDSLKIILKDKMLHFKSMDMDSLQRELEFSLKSIDFDSLTNNVIYEIDNIKWDSLIDTNSKMLPYLLNGDIDASHVPGETIVINADGTKPLIIIDGKVSNEDDLHNRFDYEIETMNVLKGNAATSIYGNDGKNGVIVVKTIKDKQILKERQLELQERQQALEKHQQAIEEHQQILKERQAQLQERKERIQEQQAERIEERAFNDNSGTRKRYSTTISDITKSKYVISATDTREEVEELAKSLKSLYNIDMNIRTLRYAKGKIVKLKYDMVYQGNKQSITTQDSDGIEDRCIVVKDDNGRITYDSFNCNEAPLLGQD